MDIKLIVLIWLKILFNLCFYTTCVLVDKCELPNNETGLCKPVSECLTARKDIQNKLKPKICSFDGINPIVCCPAGVSGHKCAQYGDEVKELKVYSIVGGYETSILDYPHMAVLGYGNSDNVQWACGGSLISDKFILTAAHCTRSELGNVEYVRLGETNIDKSYQENSDFRVVRRIRHPDYKPPLSYHDIALLELDRPVNYSIYIKPSCLHTESTVDMPGSLQATGWGATDFGASGTTTLQVVDLQIFTNEECNLEYNNSRRKLPQGIQDDIQVCAGGKKERKDTCQGDSGGPLQVYRITEDLFGIVGVTSFGKGCGNVNVPGVYTRISFYVPWIESIVWP